MKKIKFGDIMLTVAIIITILFTTACSKPTTTSGTSTTTNATTTTSIQNTQYAVNTMTATAIGTYLVDSRGVTLYWTNRDTVGISNITGAVLANWPVFYTTSISVPSSLNASDFGTMTRTDGTMQTTYKGWPLYYYIKDTASGDTLGQGLDGVWFAVVPTTSSPPLPTSTTSSTTTSTSSTTTSTTTTSSTSSSTTTSSTTTPTSTTTTPYSY